MIHLEEADWLVSILEKEFKHSLTSGYYFRASSSSHTGFLFEGDGLYYLPSATFDVWKEIAEKYNIKNWELDDESKRLLENS
jgi:hypothetical protein